MRVCASAGARVCMCANVCLRRFAWPPAALPSHRPSATFLIAKMRLAPQCLCICMYACACVCVLHLCVRVCMRNVHQLAGPPRRCWQMLLGLFVYTLRVRDTPCFTGWCEAVVFGQDSRNANVLTLGLRKCCALHLFLRMHQQQRQLQQQCLIVWV